MDTGNPLSNTPALIAYIDKLTGQLVKQHLTLADLAQISPPRRWRADGQDSDEDDDDSEANEDESDDTGQSDEKSAEKVLQKQIERQQKKPQLEYSILDASTKSFRINVETSHLVRVTEDLLMLSRRMKELWLFGKLNTLEDNVTSSREDEGTLQKKVPSKEEKERRKRELLATFPMTEEVRQQLQKIPHQDGEQEVAQKQPESKLDMNDDEHINELVENLMKPVFT